MNIADCLSPESRKLRPEEGRRKSKRSRTPAGNLSEQQSGYFPLLGAGAAVRLGLLAATFCLPTLSPLVFLAFFPRFGLSAASSVCAEAVRLGALEFLVSLDTEVALR